MARRGKTVALWCAAGAVMVVLGAAGIFRNWVIEEYYLFRLEKWEGPERESAARVLGGLRSARAVPRLVELCRQEQAVPVPGSGTELYAEALINIGVPAAAHILADHEALRVHHDELTRSKDVWILGRIGKVYHEAVNLIAEGLKSGDPAVRTSCAEVLGGIGPGAGAALPDLIGVLRSDPDSVVRVAACSAVGRLGRDGVPIVPALQAVLREGPQAARWYAVVALGRTRERGEAAIPVLLDSLRSEDEVVRRLSVEALATIAPGKSEVIMALPNALQDTDAGVRAAAGRVVLRTPNQNQAEPEREE